MAVSAKPLFRAMQAKPSVDPRQSPMSILDDAEVMRPARPSLRRADDFYPTGQPEAIRALLAREGQHIRRLGQVWEPACGDGALVREIRGAGIPCIASDLVDRGCAGAFQADFFASDIALAPAIITNPPFNLISARDGHGRWLRHSLALPGWDYIALLLSWDWCAARQNGLGALLESNPFSYVYLMRWKLDFTGEGSPPQRNGWFVWRRNWTETPMAIRFMDRDDGRQSVFPGVA